MSTPTGSTKDARAGWIVVVAFAGLVLLYHANLFDWLVPTATVQQVRSANGETKLWMNDGTIWSADVSTASLMIVGDDVRYGHVNEAQPGQSELCTLIDKTRPGLNFMASRIAGDPANPSCPAGNDEESRVDRRVDFDPDTTLETYTLQSEPPGRVTPNGHTCPEGYKPIWHRYGVDGNVQHIDCVPVTQ